MKFLQGLWKDVKRGENIDLYLAVLFAIVLAALNILGVSAVKDWLPGLTVALLGLMAVSLLGNRQRLEGIEQRLSQTSEGVLKRKFPDEQIKTDLTKAEDVLLIGVSLSRTIRSNLALFDQRLQQGAKIRVLLVDPSSPAAEIAARRLPVGVSAERARTDILYSLSSLQELAKTRDGLEFRVMNNPMSFGGFWLDTGAARGVIYLENYSFKMQDEDVPKLVLRPEDDFWYSFYSRQAQTLWEHAEAYVPTQGSTPARKK